MRNPYGTIEEFFAVIWSGEEAPHLPVVPGEARFQSFWEFATLLLVLLVWGDRFVDHSLEVLGDNTAALSNALSLKGRGPMLAVAREISWRRARRAWQFRVGHLPSEHNNVANSLSRVADPKGAGWPSRALSAASEAKPPRLQDVWLACPR